MEVGSQWVMDQVKDLVKNHQLLVDALSPLGDGAIKGMSCGCLGHVRISFGGLVEKDCHLAAERLKKGFEELVNDIM
nr:hypothetical protein [Tanacetum cinerariifolium]